MGIATGLVYVGGGFTTVAGASRLHVAALDATTGAASNWQPNPDGDIYAMYVNYDVTDLLTHVYMGGSFTSVFGFPRSNFAMVDATVGSPTFNQPTAFNPAPNGPVRALAISGRAVITTYMGGDFTYAAGQPRSSLAAFNGATLTSWNPGAEQHGRLASALRYDAVRRWLLQVSRRAVEGVRRRGLDLRGAVTAWDPKANAPARVFAPVDTTMWLGGDFTSVGSVWCSNLARLDLTTGESSDWPADVTAPVYALESIGGLIYIGGAFGDVSGLSAVVRRGARRLRRPLDVGPVARRPGARDRRQAGRDLPGRQFHARDEHAAEPPRRGDRRSAAVALELEPERGRRGRRDRARPAVGLRRGAVHGLRGTLYAPVRRAARPERRADPASSHCPRSRSTRSRRSGSTLYLGFDGQINIGGQARKGIVAFKPPTNTPLPWEPQCDGSVYSILPSGSSLYLGGAFSHMGGQVRENLAQVDTASAAVSSFNAPIWNFQNVFALGGGATRRLRTRRDERRALRVRLLHRDHVEAALGGRGVVHFARRSRAFPLCRLAFMRATPNPARGRRRSSSRCLLAARCRVEIHNVAGRLVRAFEPGCLPPGRTASRGMA
jgi:hypothetical protein